MGAHRADAGKKLHEIAHQQPPAGKLHAQRAAVFTGCEDVPGIAQRTARVAAGVFVAVVVVLVLAHSLYFHKAVLPQGVRGDVGLLIGVGRTVQKQDVAVLQYAQHRV